MITVGMGDHCFVNRFPGVNIKLTLRAIQSFTGEFDQCHIDKLKSKSENPAAVQNYEEDDLGAKGFPGGH
jgi:hypothetical protein